jgi:hypothetical protein
MTVRKDSLVRVARWSLLGLAALLTVLGAVALASRHKGREELAGLMDRYAAAQAADAADEQDPKPDTPSPGNPPKKQKSPQDQQAERICKRNVFSPPPKKKKSPKLTGVLGDEAYFDGQGKGYKVGQSYQGAKIKEIGADWVEVEQEGKASKLYVYGPGSGGPSPPSSPSRPTGAPPGVTISAVSPGVSAVRMRASPSEIPPEAIERFKKMPPEQRDRLLERMPAEMREKIKNAL